MYLADVRAREAIEVLKNYVGDEKKGMSYSCIIIHLTIIMIKIIILKFTMIVY